MQLLMISLPIFLWTHSMGGRTGTMGFRRRIKAALRGPFPVLEAPI